MWTNAIVTGTSPRLRQACLVQFTERELPGGRGP
jgi:hypothetical protein